MSNQEQRNVARRNIFKDLRAALTSLEKVKEENRMWQFINDEAFDEIQDKITSVMVRLNANEEEIL